MEYESSLENNYTEYNMYKEVKRDCLNDLNESITEANLIFQSDTDESIDFNEDDHTDCEYSSPDEINQEIDLERCSEQMRQI